MQQVLSLAAIVPSCNLGLIDTDDLTISGDGTCVHAHANSYGHKKCNCLEQGILNCTCDRHYSDVDASWGWDSDLNAYYYGHTLYMFSYHNNQIGTDVTPLCQAGYRMANWGMCSQKNARKWRCPVACGKEETCDCKSNCSTSAYGRCIYTKPEWDLRLYPPVPRGTEEYKKIYNNRTGSERVNDRILNDYKLHSMHIHGKKRFSFFTMIAGINIHLDAQIKYKHFYSSFLSRVSETTLMLSYIASIHLLSLYF